MKNYIKSALDTLTALDFRLDHEDRKLRTDRWVFTHGNSPNERLTLNFKMSEQAARTVVQRAKQIVGLATSGAAKSAPKVNQRQKMEREAERKRAATVRALAEAKEAEATAQRHVAATAKRYGELNRLINGKGDEVSIAAISADAMLTIEQVADSTGVTDIAVRRAIANGKLEAYQCGKDVKVKGADVRDWLATA